MLAFHEYVLFNPIAEVAPAGVYRARDLLGPMWEHIPDKTDYGRRLRGSVEAGIFSRVTRIGKRSRTISCTRSKPDSAA